MSLFLAKLFLLQVLMKNAFSMSKSKFLSTARAVIQNALLDKKVQAFKGSELTRDCFVCVTQVLFLWMPNCVDPSKLLWLML